MISKALVIVFRRAFRIGIHLLGSSKHLQPYHDGPCTRELQARFPHPSTDRQRRAPKALSRDHTDKDPTEMP